MTAIDLAAMWAAPPEKPKPRYVYRSRYYAKPPGDWPAPKEACHICCIQKWPASWKWNGYHWECTRRHESE